MKFTDGNWLVREGYNVHFPRAVHEAIETNEDVTLYAPCKDINHRGDTLDGPLLTVKLSSPADNIVRVQTWHYKGGKEKYPHFDVKHQPSNANINMNEKEITFSSGDLNVKVDKDKFGMEFYNGDQRIALGDSKALAWIEGPDDTTYMRGQLNLTVGEQIYGLGERFTPYVKNGQSVDIWNKDGGTSSEQSYKNVPFFLSNKGYGVFVNHPEEVSFE